MDWSFLNDAVPKQQEAEPVKTSGTVNVTVRVDADCMLMCDDEYVDLPLKAGMMAKTTLPMGQHLLTFISEKQPNIKVEKIVVWPEADKNYLVIVNELSAAMPPAMPQIGQQQMPRRNSALDEISQRARRTSFAHQQFPPMPGSVSPPMPGTAPTIPSTPPPFNNN